MSFQSIIIYVALLYWESTKLAMMLENKMKKFRSCLQRPFILVVKFLCCHIRKEICLLIYHPLFFYNVHPRYIQLVQWGHFFLHMYERLISDQPTGQRLSLFYAYILELREEKVVQKDMIMNTNFFVCFGFCFYHFPLHCGIYCLSDLSASLLEPKSC